MAFQQGLSGLHTSSKGLDVVGHNVANSSTVGFKSSNAHFADVYAASLNGSAASQIGIGSMLASVFQQFTQGNITTTNNSLDIAINGGGFFNVVRDGIQAYTRNGQFHTDLEGYIVNDQNYKLMGYPVSDTGQVIPSTPVPIKIDAGNIAPRPTGADAGGDARLLVNLDSSKGAPTNSPFNPTNPLTYTYSTAQTFYDTLGVEHAVTYYFVSDPPTTAGDDRPWHVYATLDGDPTTKVQMSDLVFDTNGMPKSVSYPSVTPGYTNTGSATAAISGSPGGTFTVEFDATTPPTQYSTDGGTTWNTYTSGTPITVGTATVTISGTPGAGDKFSVTDATSDVRKALPDVWDVKTGAETPLGTGQPNWFLDFTGSTSFAGQNTVNSNYQGGFAQGQLKNISVGPDGILLGNYSNGQAKVLAQIVLSTFPNMNGLVDAGNNLFLASASSGQPLIGVPESGARGQLRALAVEESNVDLTNELVNMITLQRNYQANAQTVKTQDQIMQTIVNLR